MRQSVLYVWPMRRLLALATGWMWCFTLYGLVCSTWTTISLLETSKKQKGVFNCNTTSHLTPPYSFPFPSPPPPTPLHLPSSPPSPPPICLLEEGGDWDRRNRLKTYHGLYAMSIRDFKLAATYFFETMATFTSTELMEYKTFVKYAMFCCMVAMERSDLKEKVRWAWCVPSWQHVPTCSGDQWNGHQGGAAWLP